MGLRIYFILSLFIFLTYGCLSEKSEKAKLFRKEKASKTGIPMIRENIEYYIKLETDNMDNDLSFNSSQKIRAYEINRLHFEDVVKLFEYNRIVEPTKRKTVDSLMEMRNSKIKLLLSDQQLEKFNISLLKISSMQAKIRQRKVLDSMKRKALLNNIQSNP